MKNDNFSCENCGGMMRFDSRTQSLKCENCGTEKELPRTLTWERHKLNEYDHLLKNEKNDDVELKNFRGNTNRFDVYINKKYTGTINYNLEINKDTFAIENVEQKIRNLIRKVR